jgi:predicted nucleic acid-binding protein
VTRHPLADLLHGAWDRRENLRVADALYVELAESLRVKLVTTDQRLKSMHVAHVVEL